MSAATTLVVDDEALDRTIMTDMLESEGYAVHGGQCTQSKSSTRHTPPSRFNRT